MGFVPETPFDSRITMGVIIAEYSMEEEAFLPFLSGRKRDMLLIL